MDMGKHTQRIQHRRGSSFGSSIASLRCMFFSREAAGVTCLSVVSTTATILLIWGCIVRGGCEHWGHDACSSRKNQIGFQGNADFYGLGIRLGIYSQWSASLLANTILGRRARSLTTVPYIGFQVAVLGALLYLVFKSDCTFVAELFLVLYILFGGFLVVLAPEIVRSFKHSHCEYRLFDTFVWSLVGLVVPVSAWFWIRLASVKETETDFYRTPGHEGDTSMFLLVRVRGRSLRKVGAFMAFWNILLGLFALEKVTLASVYKALDVELRPLWFLSIDGFRDIVTLLREDFQQSLDGCTHEGFDVHQDLRSTRFGHKRDSSLAVETSDSSVKLCSFMTALIGLIFSIYAIELTLEWNHVSDINSVESTGQIVPLFVGIFNLGSVMWELLANIHERPSSISEIVRTEKEIHLYDYEACMWQSVGKLNMTLVAPA